MTSTAVEMRRTWLVQRLEKPRDGFGAAGPFSFGGGLRNGGLSDDAMNALKGAFRFDYMGAAEFEFGAVPKALSGMAQDHKRLVADEMSISSTKICLLARKEHVAEVKSRVRALAKKDYTLKEPTHLPRVLNPSADDRWSPETCGWLELDNGFFFFTDRDMWATTSALFGVEVSA